MTQVKFEELLQDQPCPKCKTCNLWVAWANLPMTQESWVICHEEEADTHCLWKKSFNLEDIYNKDDFDKLFITTHLL